MSHAVPGGNLFAHVVRDAEGERFEDLLNLPGARVERIVSTGQATPEGDWLSQDWTEWVLLLSGSARLRFEGEPEARRLKAGDWVTIEPNARHRVDWTAPGEATVWLALHIGERATD
jgi:cupin 2 domain-containing protein